MNEGLHCEFFLIRYFPDIVKGEFVNIGVIVRKSPSVRPEGSLVQSQMLVKVNRDWSRVIALDRFADVELLNALADDLELCLTTEGKNSESGSRLLELLRETLSNSIQLSDPMYITGSSLSQELEHLTKMYVETA